MIIDSKFRILLVTCCLEKTRYEILERVVENIANEFSWCIDKIDIFDNASTYSFTTKLFDEFENVYMCDTNIGYWSAINWWLKNIDADTKYTYIIESDMIHKNAKFIIDCINFLNKNVDVGSIRAHEYSIEKWYLYNKDMPSENSVRRSWQRHTNGITGDPITFSKIENKIAITNFVAQLPAINRYETMKHCFSELEKLNSFVEFDFQRFYWEKYNKTGIIDGGIFTCDERTLDSNCITGSWTNSNHLREIGYKSTRNDKILKDSFSVKKIKLQYMILFMNRIMIIGGTGSLGKKLIEYYLPNNELHIYSRDEAKQWTIKNELLNSSSSYNQIRFHVGDVRNKDRIKTVIREINPNIIIIAAALKQVDTCENTPYESILTNIIGTQNVIDAAEEILYNKDVTILLVSTDKACSPVNVYGMCKAVSERVITSRSINSSNIKYISVRYGNVLESRGSIIPLFKYQSLNCNFITVTDRNMTRFVMTLDDSVSLIDYAINNLKNGQICIPKLNSMKIGDLANIFSKMYNVPIKIVGPRPGEKMHEDLINESESSRTIDIGKYYVINNAYSESKNKRFTYTSNDSESILSQNELEARLQNLKIINKDLSEYKGLSIEEINTLKVKKLC